LQQKCIKEVSHQRYRINIIKASIKKLEKRLAISSDEEKERCEMLQTDLIRRKAQLYEMENSLPKPNGTYLSIIVGNVNISMLDKNQKFSYKNEYEKFKLVMSLIALGLSTINSFTNVRTLDLIHMFLLVWYYCTLTIRESILKVNGSRISGWWRAHHFISTVLAAVMLVWPIGAPYYAFRSQFMYFNVYISIVQYMQFMYQRGVLYRMKALGQSQQMDVTMEGFQSWMWKSLSFLLPILFFGYILELYNAYTLWGLCSTEGADWHEPALCLLFFILFLGNTLTTAATIPKKLQDRLKLKYRFTKLDKYMWTHKKRRVSFRNPEGSPVRRAVVEDLGLAKEAASYEETVVRRRLVEANTASDSQTTAPASTNDCQSTAPDSDSDSQTTAPASTSESQSTASASTSDYTTASASTTAICESLPEAKVTPNGSEATFEMVAAEPEVQTVSSSAEDCAVSDCADSAVEVVGTIEQASVGAAVEVVGTIEQVGSTVEVVGTIEQVSPDSTGAADAKGSCGEEGPVCAEGSGAAKCEADSIADVSGSEAQISSLSASDDVLRSCGQSERPASSDQQM